MKLIGITQSTFYYKKYNEKRNFLNQTWIDFFVKLKLIPFIIPNNLNLVKKIIKQIKFDGIVLTGGGTLIELGGTDIERDKVEKYLLKFAIKKEIPLIGICHGMQVNQNSFGINLNKIGGHIMKQQKIVISEKEELVNSYHDFGTCETNEIFNVWAFAKDGVVKAITHKTIPITGIMWHPERLIPFSKRDIKLFKQIFES